MGWVTAGGHGDDDDDARRMRRRLDDDDEAGPGSGDDGDAFRGGTRANERWRFVEGGWS